MPITALGFLSHLPLLQHFSQHFTLEYVKHHTTNRVVRWIIWFNTIAVKSKILFKNIYEDSILVKKIVNNVSDISKSMKEFSTQESHEKHESKDIWMNIIAYGTQENTIIYDDNYKYDISLNHSDKNGVLNDEILHELVNMIQTYKEDVVKIYTSVDDEDEDNEHKTETLSDMSSVYETQSETDSETEDVPLNEFMIIMKYYDRKMVRKYSIKSPNMDDTAITLNRSSVKFMTVEYLHEEMDEPIELHLPKEYYIEGNYLFTPVFILMLLKNQSSPYHFDLNYKLYIIDNKTTMFELNSNKYVFIGSDDYQIRDL
jgi:hypothetical protein